MYRPVLLAVVVLAAAFVPAVAGAQTAEGDCSFPVERTDVTGTEVRVTEEPTRVVTLNPSAAQTMWEIGAQEKVTGVTKYASNLDGAAEKTNISGAGQTINNEEVVGLEPDLVLAPNTVSNDTVGTLREAGLTVYRFQEAESIDDIKRKTAIIGELTGECAGATGRTQSTSSSVTPPGRTRSSTRSSSAPGATTSPRTPISTGTSRSTRR